MVADRRVLQEKSLFGCEPKTLPFPADEVEQALAERDRRATT